MSQATIDLVRRELQVDSEPVQAAPTPGYWKAAAQRLTRDPVLGEMSDHLLEDGGFLSGSQLGNEERGAEV